MTDSKKIGRRSARKRAFQFVYAMNFRSFADKTQLERAFHEMPEDVDFLDGVSIDETPIPAEKPLSADAPQKALEDREFAVHLAAGVHLWKDEIDQVVQRFSKHWRIDRIAKAELSILRLAVYEMLHEPGIPLRVSINEAVELSKEFADDQSFPFVNGILDAVARAVSHGEFGISKQF